MPRITTPVPDVAGSYRFHLTARSANAKTGPIPVSTSPAQTCPSGDICPFKGNGCYAERGPLALHWRAVTEGRRGVPWAEFLASIRALQPGQLWRHNQAGDLYRPGTVTGRAALAALVDANRGRRGFTYSHHRRTPAVAQAFRAATASCHSETEADAAIADGLRAVFVVAADDPRTIWRTAGGYRAVVCPAQRFDAITCERCRLCQARPQNVTVVFRAHGTGAAAIERAIAAAGANG
jgi:hypothetical protein